MIECVCTRAANDNQAFNHGYIKMPSDEVLTRPATLRRMAMAYRGLNLSRRSILDFLADQIYQYQGIVTEDGRSVEIIGIDLDAVFRTDDDPSERWLSNFLNFAVNPPHQRAQQRVTYRLAVLWLGLAIARRHQAELVIR
jgi:hypothetical protein